MTIAWRPAQKRAKVQRILKKHHVHSSECDRAAKSIWPLAKEQDARASYWLMLGDGPGAGLLAKGIPNPPLWLYHVCVETESHAVCAMTGADGIPSDLYVEEKFQYADGVSTLEIESTDELVAQIEKVLAT